MAEYTDYVALANLLHPSILDFEFIWNTLHMLETVIQYILSAPPPVSWADEEGRMQHCYSILVRNGPINTSIGDLFQDFNLHELFDLVKANTTVLQSPPRRQGRQSRFLTWLIYSAMHGDRVGDVLPPLSHFLPVRCPERPNPDFCMKRQCQESRSGHSFPALSMCISPEEGVMFPKETSKNVIYYVLLEFVRLAMNVADVLIVLRPNETSHRLPHTTAIEDRLAKISGVLVAQYWLRINNHNSGIPDEVRARLVEINLVCSFGYFMDFIVAATMWLLGPLENLQLGYLVNKVLQDTTSHTEGGREAWDTFQLERSRRSQSGPLLSTQDYRPPEFSGSDVPAELLKPVDRQGGVLLRAALNMFAESSSEEGEIRDNDEGMSHDVNVDRSKEQDEEYLIAVMNEASAPSQTADSNAPVSATELIQANPEH